MTDSRGGRRAPLPRPGKASNTPDAQDPPPGAGPRAGAGVTFGDPLLWMAYYSDLSSVVVFSSEIEALRYAVERTMSVGRLELGEPIQAQIK